MNVDEPGTTVAPETSSAPADAASTPPRRRRRGLEFTAIGVIGVLLLSSLAAGGAALYRELYSPTAFVLHYLDLLGDGRAVDALAVPGVAVDAAALTAAGLPTGASDALLRSSTLAALTDVAVVSEEPTADGARVTVTYSAGGHDGTTTFDVARDGWLGVVPAWRFSRSPLAVVDLIVRGSMRFAVNDFEVDKRQVAVEGVAVDPLAPVPMLVFSPGIYAVEVDTAISATPGVAVLADVPLADIPLDLQAEATAEFVGVVQDRVEEFLEGCATQEVLQPTGCPFGFTVQNRIVGLPAWSIAQQPEVTVLPDGAGWTIPSASAVAHIDVDVRSLFDGTVRTVAQDVPFSVTGSIDVLPDGTASIEVAGTPSD